MVNILPSATIRKNYNEVSELCKRTREPVFLTKNGSGDLVVMDIETYSRRESMLKLKEILLQSEAGQLAGKPGYTAEEAVQIVRDRIARASDARQDKAV